MKTIEEVIREATNKTNKDYEDHDVTNESLDKVLECLTKYPLDNPSHNKKRIKLLGDLIKRDAGVEE